MIITISQDHGLWAQRGAEDIVFHPSIPDEEVDEPVPHMQQLRLPTSHIADSHLSAFHEVQTPSNLARLLLTAALCVDRDMIP